MIDVSGIIEGTLVEGSIYALVGAGFVVLYRATKVLNFAQGSLMALGAFVFRDIAVSHGLGLVPGPGAHIALYGNPWGIAVSAGI